MYSLMQPVSCDVHVSDTGQNAVEVCVFGWGLFEGVEINFGNGYVHPSET